jgi:NitT/TauT family transport system ATP-binding protein
MDEPFSELDAAIREDLQKTMRIYHREFCTTNVLVTHDIEEALLTGDHILVLQTGCNRKARVMENPLAGGEDIRSKKEFQQLFNTLRLMLGGNG